MHHEAPESRALTSRGDGYHNACTAILVGTLNQDLILRR